MSTSRTYSASGQSTDTFGRVLCHARDHHFIVDGPVQNGCPGEELTPPEIFLAGVASCGVELIQVIARDQGTAIGSVHVSVDATVDRSAQARADVTTFSTLRMQFSFGGTDGATAAALVEGFRRR